MARLFDDGSTQGLFVNGAAVTAVPFSVSLWMYADDVSISPALFFLGDKDADNEYFSLEFRGGDAGDNVAIVARSAAAGRIQTDSTSGVTVNTWHHVCGVFSSTTSRTIYLDGGNSATGTTSVTPLGADRTSVGYLARLSATGYFSGRIANVAMWPVALTSGEVASLATGICPTQVRSSDLMRYWPIYGVASPEQDRISLDTLTLTGSPVKADGPKMISPRRRRPIGYTVSAPSSSVPVFVHHYRMQGIA